MPLLIPKTGDNFQYLTWIEAHKRGLLIENFHTTEPTEKAYISPLALLVARLATWTGSDVQVVYEVVRYLLYILAAFAILYSFDTFLPRSWKAVGSALVVILCCVPVRSLLIPILAFRGSGAFRYGVPGSDEYMYVANSIFQDWNHSIYGLVGMITVVAGVAAATRFAEHGTREGMIVYTCACAASALLHPFEIIILLTYGLVIVGYRRGLVAAVTSLIVPIGVAGICMLPYAIPALTVDWVKRASLVNRGAILMPPLALLGSLGPPLFVALPAAGLLLTRARQLTPVLDLFVWLLLSLMLPYFGFLPFPRHFLNGVSIAIGILCVVFLRSVWSLCTARGSRIVLATALTFASSWCLAANLGLRVFAWRAAVGEPDANSGFPEAFLTRDEDEVLRWFRLHTSPSDSVLAADPYSWLLAATPIHSFGGHPVFGYKKMFPQEWREKDLILAGAASPAETEAFLLHHGIGFVLMDSHFLNAISHNCSASAEVGGQTIYECRDRRGPE